MSIETSSMTQQSDSWSICKRPAELVRLRRKRPRNTAERPGESDSSPASVAPTAPPCLNSQSRSRGNRRNPFVTWDNALSRPKKVLVEDEDGEDVGVLMKLLSTESNSRDPPSKDSLAEKNPSEDDSLLEIKEQHANSLLIEDPLAVAPVSIAPISSTEYPADWSLKTRVLFTSPVSLSWTEQPKAQEEALGLSNSCRAQFSTPPPNLQIFLLKSGKERPPIAAGDTGGGKYEDVIEMLKQQLRLPIPTQSDQQCAAAGEGRQYVDLCSIQPGNLWFFLWYPLCSECSALCGLQEPRYWSEVRSAFQQCLVYWQHPSLPWLSLFPRINAEKSFSGKNSPWTQDVAVQESLMKEWSVSLSSLYSLLKAGLCPYFYVCSYQFTVLFRAAGLAGSGCITALISPTTRGLREAMRTEGVEFSLPLLKESRRIRKQHEAVHQRVEEEEEDQDKDLLREDEHCQKEDEGLSRDNDDSLSWLKEMGIQDQIRKPESINIQLQKEGPTLSLDHKPESAVCVEGSHSFNLINFLINCKSVVAAAGSQTGLPPTLLAPTAFRGATMNVLKGRSVSVKNLVDCTYQHSSSLELTGPILPSSLHAITALLQAAQKGNFSAALYTHAPTAVMNIETCQEQRNKAVGNLAHCGLPPASVNRLQMPSTLGKTALTHVAMNNHSCTWKSG